MKRNLTAILAAPLFCSAVLAQQQEQPAASPQEAPAQATPQEAKPQQQAQPTLDDLLGITPDRKDPAGKPRPAPADPEKSALDRKLTNSELSEAFLQAVRLMDETAVRLEKSRDTGITTQRMQEEVISKLDILIAQAQKQKQQRQSQSRRDNQDPQQQPDQQQGQQSSNQRSSESTQESPPPAGQDPQPGAAMAQGAAWGALPERVRDALLQGNADKYSSLYQKWTEAYYRKLAEESGR